MSTCVFLAMFAIPTSPQKLPTNPPPRSTRCVFLEYSVDHKDYRCLGLSTNNIVVSRHVVFDEVVFPFASSPHLTNDLDIFLQNDASSVAPMPALLLAPRVPTAGRCWWSNRALGWSNRARNRGWRSDWELERSDHPENRGWKSDCHLRQSDCPPPRGLVIGHLTDFHRAPLGYAGAIDTASTSAVAVDEGRTDGTSGQPSPDDHTGEAGFPAAGRQTHIVGHLIVAALSADPSRRRAMEEEYGALITNNTWDLIPRHVGSNVVTGKWIFKH
jgi:hypothetical protein